MSGTPHEHLNIVSYRLQGKLKKGWAYCLPICRVYQTNLELQRMSDLFRKGVKGEKRQKSEAMGYCKEQV